MAQGIWRGLGLGVLALFMVGGFKAQAAEVASAYTLQAPKGQWVVRALTHAPQCPNITWDQQAPVPMTLRAAQATLPARPDAALSERKPSVFDVTSCEALWPAMPKVPRWKAPGCRHRRP